MTITSRTGPTCLSDLGELLPVKQKWNSCLLKVSCFPQPCAELSLGGHGTHMQLDRDHQSRHRSNPSPTLTLILYPQPCPDPSYGWNWRKKGEGREGGRVY